MHKKFISAGELLADSFRLGAEVFRGGYRPDFIVAVWRGGTPIAIAVHEYLAARGAPAALVAIGASSYSGIDRRSQSVAVTGLSALHDAACAEHSLLLVDDVFDTGRTMQEIMSRLRSVSGDRCPRQIRIACPWYKPSRNLTGLRPDYYLHETDDWLVFPHEIEGLSRDELCAKPDLGAFIDDLGI